MRNLSVQSCWDHGTNLRSALKHQEARPIVWAWVNLEITKLIAEMGANNTFQTADEIADATDLLIEEFPAIKIEEIALVCKMLKAGKLLPNLYGTFRTRTLLEAFRKYEGEMRAPLLENQHRVIDPPHWRKRTSAKAGDKPFKPILASKEELQQMGIWPKESSSEE